MRRYLRHYQESGHIWQGRFKAFPIQDDEHPATVVRYVERNALRAGLVARAEYWPWSSLCPSTDGPVLDKETLPRKDDWLDLVNTPTSEAEGEAIRLAIRRDRPFGNEVWTHETAQRLGLSYSLNARGRPSGKSTQNS